MNRLCASGIQVAVYVTCFVIRTASLPCFQAHFKNGVGHVCRHTAIEVSSVMDREETGEVAGDMDTRHELDTDSANVTRRSKMRTASRFQGLMIILTSSQLLLSNYVYSIIYISST